MNTLIYLAKKWKKVEMKRAKREGRGVKKVTQEEWDNLQKEFMNNLKEILNNEKVKNYKRTIRKVRIH